MTSYSDFLRQSSLRFLKSKSTISGYDIEAGRYFRFSVSESRDGILQISVKPSDFPIPARETLPVLDFRTSEDTREPIPEIRNPRELYLTCSSRSRKKIPVVDFPYY